MIGRRYILSPEGNPVDVTTLADTMGQAPSCPVRVDTYHDEIVVTPLPPLLHLNSPDHLPPVGCPLLIELQPGCMVEAERTSYIADRSRLMEYRTAQGDAILGRFRWTYP